MNRWLAMWLIAVAIFAACKGLTWHYADTTKISWSMQFAYLFAWPGLDAPAFLANVASACRIPSPSEWCFAITKMLFGVALFWGVARQFSILLIQGWIGMAGLVFLLHFGAFHLLSCFWRSLGRNARPLMHWPILATSVADFWGRRWNTAFRDFTHRFVFRPLRRISAPRIAILGGFALSGLVHDMVISVPAGDGHGLPTLYFVIQGCALLAERSPLGKAMGLGKGALGRIFAIIIVAGPAWILFHPSFVREVILPFMTSAGAL